MGKWRVKEQMNRQMDWRTNHEKEVLYWLCQLPDLGSTVLRKIWEYDQRFSDLLSVNDLPAEKKMLLKPEQFAAVKVWKLHYQECWERYQVMQQSGMQFVTVLDEHYPAALRNLTDYPIALYVKGALPDSRMPSAAIVGARSCSAYGKQIAEEFARMLATAGVQIISGLALGIDGAAHLGAIHAGQPTFGILGCGVNICYPSSHYKLYEAMLSRGGILSEYPPDIKPEPFHFPQRNRIISGLSDLILIIEAKEKSGSLITAERGLEQGKEIYAVPGRITDRLSKGCNLLIQQGAGIALSPADILEALGVKREKKLIIHPKVAELLGEEERLVYDCLEHSSRHIDEIARDCGRSISDCMRILLTLELTGLIQQTNSHYYCKKVVL